MKYIKEITNYYIPKKMDKPSQIMSKLLYKYIDCLCKYKADT